MSHWMKLTAKERAELVDRVILYPENFDAGVDAGFRASRIQGGNQSSRTTALELVNKVADEADIQMPSFVLGALVGIMAERNNIEVTNG